MSMKTFLISLFIGALAIFMYGFKQESPYKNGDIVFQTTGGARGLAIQLATHSTYNHCGVLFYENNEWMVYEAVQPVGKISLEDFNARGKATVMRLKNSKDVLTHEAIQKLKNAFKKYNNKDYDMAFNWSDKEIYCSELVYKLYNDALEIKLCAQKKLKDFDLSNKLVKQQLTETYGKHIPLEETMVAPSDIANSELLELVK